MSDENENEEIEKALLKKLVEMRGLPEKEKAKKAEFKMLKLMIRPIKKKDMMTDKELSELQVQR